MERIQHNLIQGTPEWHQFRLEHHGASEAAAMLGLSKTTKRTELLRMKQTGIAKEFSDFVQEHILDHGHEVEALVRPMVENMISRELYPVTYSYGRLSASCDGLTMDGEAETAFECKQWNAVVAKAMQSGIFPEEHMPQCQQILMVTGADRLIFALSDGTPERFVTMGVNPDKAWQARILAGWKQFDEDLATHQHVEAPAPIIVAPIDDLPALTVELVGQVTSSNLAAFKCAALERIEAINTNLQTDEDFAIAKKTVKFLDDGEKRLVLVKQQALAQTASIDELFRTMDQLREEMKAKRLTLDKLVTQRETAVKVEIVNEGKTALAEHIAGLNKRLATVQMPAVEADFGGAIKGKRNLASMRDAVGVLLANKKIEASAIADRINLNIRALDEHPDYAFLFNDRAQIVMKRADDLAMLIVLRIQDHKKAEAERTAKIEADAKAKAEAENNAKAEAARVAAEQKTVATQMPGGASAGTSNADIRQSDNGADRPHETATSAPATVLTKPRVTATSKGVRPTAEQIIDSVSAHYRVEPSVALEWMLNTDWRALVVRQTYAA